MTHNIDTYSSYMIKDYLYTLGPIVLSMRGCIEKFIKYTTYLTNWLCKDELGPK